MSKFVIDYQLFILLLNVPFFYSIFHSTFDVIDRNEPARLMWGMNYNVPQISLVVITDFLACPFALNYEIFYYPSTNPQTI